MHLNRPHAKRSPVQQAEDRAWTDIYRRVRRDARLASDVLAQLESDTEIKRNHMALVLSCQQTVQRLKLRQKRNKRIAQFLRHCGSALADLWYALGGAGSDLGQIARELRRSAVPSPSLGRRTGGKPMPVPAAAAVAPPAEIQRSVRTG